MKKLFLLLFILLGFCTSASAGSDVYIANPNPEDRLHLRAEPWKDSESLGKYYNGAPVERIGYFNQNGWVYVRVGKGNGSLCGYMASDFLSASKSTNAMPQFTANHQFYGYHQPDTSSQKTPVPAGSMVSLMGFSGKWWHLAVYAGTSEGDYYCFVPADCPWLTDLSSQNVNVYISNPDAKDRLHLRTSPSVSSKSLGKYYNGCVATLNGFSEDGRWLEVDLYGRTGYLMREFVYIEGQGPNPTYYGIPSVKAGSSGVRVYRGLPETTQYRTVLPAGTEIEVLGIIDTKVLHVRIDGDVWFVLKAETTFSDK